MIRRTDRRQKPSPRWEPPARESDRDATLRRIAQAIRVTKALEGRDGRF